MDVAQFELVTERVRSALRLGGGDLLVVCDICAQALPVDSAAVLIDEPHLGVQPWAASDDRTGDIESAQAGAGVGPAFDVVAIGAPVEVTDLRAADRWPLFAAALNHRSAAGALLSVPLRVGAARLGTLDLYRETPGEWSPPLPDMAQQVADLIAAHLVSANSAPPPTSTLIHEAAGMVITHRAAGTADGYAWLRAEARRRNLSLADCAEAIVGRRLPVDTENRA
ncbi:GAF and ANTAR domain-containing protein [Nocardia arizonensis]|uniref:GAF and ANTAR domain-containing protein n=1 Tax=Nocardia arizonensis TaxID=1141647 RepID=UPI000A5E257C|nr:GAF and ANTAR domain-containing protein [Nocardia arizonensis]